MYIHRRRFRTRAEDRIKIATWSVFHVYGLWVSCGVALTVA
ncbi:hypothetical protein ACH4YO_41555 [Streptomyces noursei]